MKRNINELYKSIKLGHDGISLYKGRELKLNQLQDYKKIMDSALKKISRKQEIHIVESCAGNCFLSFYLAWHYQDFAGTIRFTCIEQNEQLMNEAVLTAKALGLSNMSFIASRVEEAEITEPVHIVCSLHACDIATDYTLALGVKLKARYILSVSCCQHTIHNSISTPVLRSVTRHRVYKEQIAAMTGDSMRAELLQERGYKTDIFAFTSVKNTGRNVLLRAALTPVCSARKEEARNHYEMLKCFFRTEPLLHSLLLKEEQHLVSRELNLKAS